MAGELNRSFGVLTFGICGDSAQAIKGVIEVDHGDFLGWIAKHSHCKVDQPFGFCAADMLF